MQFQPLALVPLSFAQSTPQAGAAPPQAAPVKAVGMPGVQPTSATQTPGSAPSASPQPQNSLLMWMLPVLLLVMIIPSFLGNKREKKKRDELISSIKKHDRVQTLGGIIGTVQDMTDTEVVLKVEEGRIRFAKSAIQTVLKSAHAPAGSVAEPKDAKAVSV